MRFNRGMLAAIMSMGAAMLPGLGHAEWLTLKPYAQTSTIKKAGVRGGVGAAKMLIGRRQSGRTVAMAKRAAIKSKNRHRNKSAHRK